MPFRPRRSSRPRQGSTSAYRGDRRRRVRHLDRRASAPRRASRDPGRRLRPGPQPRLVRRRIAHDPRRLRQGRDLLPHGARQPGRMEGAAAPLPACRSSSTRRAVLLPEATSLFRPTVVAVHRELGLPIEALTAPQMARRFPMIDFAGVEAGLFEPGFGALMARRAVQTLVERLRRATAATYRAGAGRRRRRRRRPARRASL